MRKYRFELILVLLLVLLTGILYYLHIAIFNDFHHLALFGLEDLAFLPIEVLIVTLLLGRLLELRDRKSRTNKINMVIGVYFSEIGNQVLRAVARYDLNLDKLQKKINITLESTDKDFKNASVLIKKYNSELQTDTKLLDEIKSILSKKRDLLANIIQNPVLLEHGSFTDLLLATFHLAEELSYRGDVSKLPGSDLEHLNLDINRAYLKIIEEWIKYLKHLKGNYPYLYSLSSRLNPLNKNLNVIVN
jgi:hypothetical protein